MRILRLVILPVLRVFLVASKFMLLHRKGKLNRSALGKSPLPLWRDFQSEKLSLFFYDTDVIQRIDNLSIRYG